MQAALDGLNDAELEWIQDGMLLQQERIFTKKHRPDNPEGVP